jgi:hypothetical protein
MCQQNNTEEENKNYMKVNLTTRCEGEKLSGGEREKLFAEIIEI